MYLTPYQKKQIKFVLLLLLGIPATVFAVYKGAQYLSMATADPTPKDVVISNVTTKSLTLSWVTEKAVEAYVIPVLNGTEQTPVVDKRGEGKRLAHYVELTNLEPDTEYMFVLVSDGERYTGSENGLYKFSTAPIGLETPVPSPVHGTVTGDSVENVIVYIMFTNRSVYPVSTIVPSSGNWIVDLSALRKVIDKSMATVTGETEITLLARSGFEQGIVLTGSYSSLFDSNGKLSPGLSLEISEIANLISHFPAAAVLGLSIEIPRDDEEEPEEPEVPVTPPIITPPVDDTPSGYTGPYTIKHDISWIDMVSGDSNLNLESGESTVLVTNLTDVGFTIVWRSSSKEEGYVKYGVEENNLDKELKDIRDGQLTKEKYFTHFIESSRLEPETTYYFEVYSGNTVYDDGGEKYSVTTFSTLTTAPPFETRSGNILNASDPSDWVIVFKILDNDDLGTLGSSKYISALSDNSGNWIITVGDVRSEDGLEYFSFSNSDILQAFFLGAESKKFDVNLSQNDIELDINDIGISSGSGSVSLLSDYGIINLK